MNFKRVFSSRKSSAERGFFNLWGREVGKVAPRTFANRIKASEDLVLHLGIQRKLQKHRGCVNTLSFSGDGSILLSGSDDRMIILWNWEVGLTKLLFHSGHTDNVLQAKFMPYTDDRTIITCAADGEVRYTQLMESGAVASTMLAKHEGWVHKLAIEPGSPHTFYSCGEDGVVLHYDLRTKCATKLFTCWSIQDMSSYTSVVELRAVAIDPRNPNLFAIAGTDNYARVYDIRKYNWDGSSDSGCPTNFFCPPHLIGRDINGITGLAYSDSSELLVSYSGEHIYLFPKEGLVSNHVHSAPVPMLDEDAECASSHSPSGRCGLQVYRGHVNRDTVKGASFLGPKCEYVASGSDCGRIFIWTKKDGELLRATEGDKVVVNCIEPHPSSTVIASSGIEKDIKIWSPDANRAVSPSSMDEISTDNLSASDDTDSNSNDDNDHDDDSDDVFDDSDFDMDMHFEYDDENVDDNDDDNHSNSDEEDDDDDDDDDDQQDGSNNGHNYGNDLNSNGHNDCMNGLPHVIR
ncbi:uncharacterized protein [Typha latifolia]|uniref:uncharacterized protein n=1 Tax=Typha latifolia TaxID=4733 RepID=UPI003C2FD121